MKKRGPLTAATISGALLAAATNVFCVIPVSANSAQVYWQGISSSGAIVTDESCPIEVEHELLTFNIQEFPSEYYENADEYLAYSGQVTAEYTFYNPADYTITATLLFPLGNIPSYGHIYDGDGNLTQQDAETAGFQITVDGQAIEKQLRHSFSYSYEQFELEKDFARLADGFLPDDFYKPDLPVTEYTYQIDGVDLETYDAANAAFDLSCDGSATRIYFVQQSGFSRQKDNALRVSSWVLENGETMTVYCIGEPLKELPGWVFYKDGGTKNGEEISGSMTLVDTRTLTFRELALMDYDPESGVSENDWYNAVVTLLNVNSYEENCPVVGDTLYGPRLNPAFMGWYQYEITLEPGARITNTVTAPMYPSIDVSSSPAFYTYTYLLSPARTWSDFKDLDIVLNTPYYIIDQNPGDFEKTENGYAKSLDGLPDSELVFTLCESEHPATKAGSRGNPSPLQVILSMVLLILAGGCALFLGLRWKKRKTQRRLP